MKKLLVLLLSLAVCSCGIIEIDPDLGEKAKGTYSVYLLQVNGQTFVLPQNGVTMGVDLTRIGNKKVAYSIVINANGKQSNDFGFFDLKGTTSSMTISKDSKEYGTISGSTIKFKEIKTDGSIYSFSASK